MYCRRRGSYRGCRPCWRRQRRSADSWRGVEHAIKLIDDAYGEARANFVAGSDISGFFTKIRQAEVVRFIEEQTDDSEFIDLFARAQKVELVNASEMDLEDLKMFPTDEAGVAQGCPLSAFAGNVALGVLRQGLERSRHHLHPLHRRLHTAGKAQGGGCESVSIGREASGRVGHVDLTVPRTARTRHSLDPSARRFSFSATAWFRCLPRGPEEPGFRDLIGSR